jgi:hypothetical protein
LLVATTFAPSPSLARLVTASLVIEARRAAISSALGP